MLYIFVEVYFASGMRNFIKIAKKNLTHGQFNCNDITL